MTYRVEVKRDEAGAWVARVPSVPGCHTYGRTLHQVEGRIREALGLWVGDAEAADIVLDVRLPADARQRVRAVHAMRAKATRAQEEAQEQLSMTARELVETHGLSLRDAAELIGVSHQRIQQVLPAR
jgi:predicted RNase H-like HicB family nuclease